jgi:hypothetical protein
MSRATTDEIAELLGDDLEDSIIDRIAAVDASIEEIGEAIDDLAYERRYGESREASSHRVEEVRAILDELPSAKDLETEPDSEEDNEGLTVVEGDELARETS